MVILRWTKTSSLLPHTHLVGLETYAHYSRETFTLSASYITLEGTRRPLGMISVDLRVLSNYGLIIELFNQNCRDKMWYIECRHFDNLAIELFFDELTNVCNLLAINVLKLTKNWAKLANQCQ